MALVVVGTLEVTDGVGVVAEHLFAGRAVGGGLRFDFGVGEVQDGEVFFQIGSRVGFDGVVRGVGAGETNGHEQGGVLGW